MFRSCLCSSGLRSSVSIKLFAILHLSKSEIHSLRSCFSFEDFEKFFIVLINFLDVWTLRSPLTSISKFLQPSRFSLDLFGMWSNDANGAVQLKFLGKHWNFIYFNRCLHLWCLAIAHSKHARTFSYNLFYGTTIRVY